MYCEFCGTSMDEGATVCSVCGNPRRTEEHVVKVKVAEAPSSFVIDGPRCAVHAGMPLVGKCPRCGKDVCIRCAPDAAQDNLTCTDCKGMTRAHAQAPAGAKCAVHPQNAASFACVSCRALTPSSEGMCTRCGDAQGLVMASRGDRFLANLIDNVVFFVPASILAVVGIVIADTTKGPKGELPVVTWALILLGCLASAGVQLAAQVNWEQSVGKRLLKIKVLRRSGAPIELWRLIILRNLAVSALSQLCGFIGLIDALMIFSADQRCLHDYLADSMVVDVSQP